MIKFRLDTPTRIIRFDNLFFAIVAYLVESRLARKVGLKAKLSIQLTKRGKLK